MTISVFPEWMMGLPMQQQSVLVLACRGPDGLEKFHASKTIWRHYRGSVLKAAWQGRSLRPGEGGGNDFMSLELFGDDGDGLREGLWREEVRQFFKHVDAIPHHCYMHLIHGAEILGYKHPDWVHRGLWCKFYLDCVENMHLEPETEVAMDERLCDWHRVHWSTELNLSKINKGEAR